MIFEEANYIDLTSIPTIFIYFLLQNDEVVYVGQTVKGLSRVYSHTKDKKFNRICVIECDADELDYLENKYILKYDPIYNKKQNMRSFYSIDKVVHSLNKRYSKYSTGVFDYKFNKSKVQKMAIALGINFTMCNNKQYITAEEFFEIVGCIDDYMKGAPLDEVFNIGI